MLTLDGLTIGGCMMAVGRECTTSDESNLTDNLTENGHLEYRNHLD